jgi:FKBP-type peptidyl-prolyl cis-trans isomerase FklB
MNSTKKLILGLFVCFGTAAVLKADGTNQLADEKSRVSYAIGMMLGHNWQQQGLEVDPDIFARAVKDIQAGGKTLLTEQEMHETLVNFQKEFAAKQQKRRAELAEKDKQEGEAFLAANKEKPGVQTLPDGLQYLVITNGTGPVPGPNDTVTVNYRGTLINGTEFDSSYKRGQPAQFPVGGVIHGWTEALEKMPVGSKWKLFIPAGLAYGEQGNRGIPPNSTLIFEVELLDAKSPAPPKAAAPLTSDIIKVPSAEEMKKGAKIEVIKSDEAAKAEQQTNK